MYLNMSTKGSYLKFFVFSAYFEKQFPEYSALIQIAYVISHVLRIVINFEGQRSETNFGGDEWSWEKLPD